MAEPPSRISLSPFASKLGTNYCPLDDELLQIRTFLVEPLLSRLKGLDGQIADLQKAMDKLTAERDSVAAFIAAHKALISPVRRLPLDILQEIFAACLPTHRNCVMSAVEAPVLLGRICSAWRATSIATPQLWSRLHVVEPSMCTPEGIWGVPGPGFEEKVAQRLETTKTWLERAGQCPLSISFQCFQRIPPSPGALEAAATRTLLFMQAIILFAARWTNITLSVAKHAGFVSSTVLELLSGITESDVPMLRKLEIFEDTNATKQGLTQFTLFKAPSLASFTFTGRYVTVEDLPVRWGNLTSLSVGNVLPGRVVLELFSRCSQLQVCSIIIDSNISADAGPVVELPLLHSLQFTGFSEGIETTLRRLSLPKLRHLAVKNDSFHLKLPPSIEDFLAFLAGSSCFESLEVDGLCPQFWFMQLLHGLPASTICLQTALLDGTIGDDAITALTPSPENPESLSCPALRELRIINSSSPSDAALLRFIKARMTAVSPTTLRKVTIEFCRERQVDILPDIQPFLSDSGLEVTLTYSTSPVAVGGGIYSPWQGLPDAGEIV
ncbi:hypothetical protein C8R46DRAFT_1128702 [Mycena filopes]|nr:hypothetical protein C8R46DRAFT_1128702 [Mycena filopes]